jgi:hypothetical protein|tara:strand:+ start:320 stop:1279 length:960 start_codon:yes stop_codon:yes gene_type:complete
MKNNLIIILSHCNSREKREILIDNIKKLKTQNLDVLLLSHIPIPPSIQQMVEYFIYDKSNPIINWPHRGMVFWKKILGDTNYRLQTIYPDYGWTAFNQILLGGNLGLSLDYNHFSFINYDIQITDPVIGALNNPTSFLTSKVQPCSEAKPRYPSFMLNILNRKNLKALLPLINKEHYTCDTLPWKEPGRFKSAEDYWSHLITNFSYTTHPEPIVDLIVFDNPESMFNYSGNNQFKLFFQNNNTHSTIQNDGVSKILLFDIQIPNLKLIVNDEYTNIIKGKNELINLPKIEKIGFTVEDVYTDLTNKYKESIYQTIEYTK